MTQQGSLFRPGSANREEAVPIQAKLLARKTDPATSKRAAKRVVESGRLSKQQAAVLSRVRYRGPGTAWKLAGGEKHQAAYYILCRRLPELERKRLVRVQQDSSKPCRCKPNAKRCRCRDVVRDNSRVWEIVPNG